MLSATKAEENKTLRARILGQEEDIFAQTVGLNEEIDELRWISELGGVPSIWFSFRLVWKIR